MVRPGVVTDDTKTYLYLDPGKFLRQVFSMWNPDVALGTVTHEYIGYLLPMGPFYWLCSVLHVPLWVAQRLWLGGILFAAGAGVLFLCRTLKLRGPGTLVAAMAFMLSPYFLQYAGRISVILLPWAGLPWMVGLAALALRRGGWKYPALFALVVALVSGINASSVLYAGLAPVLWLIYAVTVEREARWLDAGWVAVKIAGLSLLVCLWWITGLQIEAAYGVNTLKFTETVKATSETSTASEVLRGLGYWYFYGGDRDGPWTFSSVVYTQYLWVIGVSFLLPALSFLAAIFLRWRTRAYFVALIVVGVVLSVGAHPFDSPTVVGGLAQVVHDRDHGRAGDAVDRPCDPAGGPRDGDAARRRRERPLAPVVLGGPGDNGRAGRPRGGQQPGHLQRRHHRQRHDAAGTGPDLPPAGCRLPQLGPPEHEGARDPGRRFCRLQLGQHRGHARGGAPRPALRHPGAADHGFHGDGGHAVCDRRARSRRAPSSGTAWRRWPG